MQVVDYGDLSLLMRPAYTAALEAEIAAAEPWNLTYRRDAPQPQVGAGSDCQVDRLVDWLYRTWLGCTALEEPSFWAGLSQSSIAPRQPSAA